MRSKLTVLGVVLALLLSGTAAFAAVPNTAAGNEADHEISECATIDEPGQYEVVSDIQHDGTAADACLEVRSPDVSIDGNGHTIAGQGQNGTGIQNEAASNVTVSNVTVTGFEYGVADFGDLRLANSTLTQNVVGLKLKMASTSVVDNTIEMNSKAGVEIRTSDEGYDVVFDDNEIVNNDGAGIQSSVSTFTMTDNRIAGNGDGGVVGDDTYVTSTNNEIEDNDGPGIATGLGGVESSGDTIVDNAGDGISVAGTVVVNGSIIEKNDGSGIHVLNSGLNTGGISVNDSRIVYNGEHGIHVEAGPPTELTVSEIHGSLISGNVGFGVYNEETVVINATGNDWAQVPHINATADDTEKPGSPDGVDSPLKDPVSGALANGSGNPVSEHPERPGFSNVHFSTESPDEGEDDGSDGDDGSVDRTIAECREITEPGRYELVDDIEADVGTNDACLNIGTSDVVIDGNGHTIAGQGQNGTGILVELRENVTVSNVTVTGFERGLETAVMTDVTVVHSRFDGNKIGMSAQEDATLTVMDSEVVNSEATGISALDSTLTVVDSELVGNGASGVATGLTTATLRNNLFAENAVGLETGDDHAVSENNTYRDNAEAGIVAVRLISTNDVVEENGVGIRAEDNVTLTGTVVRNNDGHGVELLPRDPEPVFATITDSTVVDNGGDGIHVDADNSDLADPVSEFTAEIHGTTIAGNDGLGVNNTEPTVVNATGNDWGAADGPGSADDPDAPFEDPVTGALADGSGDEVSEHPEKPGVSNVHFTTESPDEDDGDGEDDGIDLSKISVAAVCSGEDTATFRITNDNDEAVTLDYELSDAEAAVSDESGTVTVGADGAKTITVESVSRLRADTIIRLVYENETIASTEASEEYCEDDSAESTAYQVDLATGEVIETLGDDENDFYGRQGRLLQAKSLTADGELTRSHDVPLGTATTDGLSYGAVTYDAETGEMTVTVSLADDASNNETVTLAAYELPGDTTEFVRDRADGQELVAYETVTLSPGDEVTLTIDVDGDE